MLKVGIRFLKHDNTLSTTKYTFIVRKPDIEEYLCNNPLRPYTVISDRICYNFFNITNQNGYNYREQYVAISSINFITEEEIKNNNYNEIIKIEYVRSSAISVIEEDLRSKLKREKVAVVVTEEAKIERNKDNMFKKMMKDVKIGKVNNIKMSIYGPAFNSADGTSLAYDKKNKEWIDVTGMTMDTFGTAFSIPVAKNQLKVNDYILHNGMWVRVSEIGEDNTIMVEKIFEKELSSILPTKNMFGFDFYVKLMYFGIEDMMGKANKDNPFGNMLPLMMMENGNKDVLPLMLMMQNMNVEGAQAMDFNNPMMMYIMMKDSDLDSDIFPLMLMMQNTNR